MPRKVKIAPHLVRYFRMLDTSVSPQIRREFRALLAVAKSLHEWFMDEDDDRNESTAAMLRAQYHLRRISCEVAVRSQMQP
jgi:hypothetical protein